MPKTKLPPEPSFTDRLRSARAFRKLKQSELGKLAKLPPSSIAHFESGSRKPSIDNLKRLADALEVTADYLLGRFDEPGLAQASDPLFRDAAKLTASDHALVKDFLKMLAERNEAWLKR